MGLFLDDDEVSLTPHNECVQSTYHKGSTFHLMSGVHYSNFEYVTDNFGNSAISKRQNGNGQNNEINVKRLQAQADKK